MDTTPTYTVGQVAGIAHVSVRTLHHYDELGLLEPSERSDAGYRLYTLTDMERLQQVLFYKELGFELAEIADLMADPDFDRTEALVTQRELIAEQALRLEGLLALIDKTIASSQGGLPMTENDLFDGFDPAEYEDEARERWGDTDAYKESARRTAAYTPADWARYKKEANANNLAIAALLDEGAAPDDPRVLDAIEEARLLIDTWFYPCSRRMHAELGKMYVADPRFTKTYEKIRTGMAQFMADATAANLDRGEAE